MTEFMLSAVPVTQELELEFPNLFNGMAINYFRGFELFGISIYWYGILITLGVALAYLYAHFRAPKWGLSRDRMFDVVFGALIGGFLGARIYFCVFTTLDPNSPLNYDIITTFTTIRDGGLAIYGGIIGGFVVGFIMCRIRKVHFGAMCDLAALGFLIGQTIGRWGNFINQEAHGGVCEPDFIFGMTGTIISTQVEPGALVHPCFLYESAWCLLGFILLHLYSAKLRSYDGEIALLYVAWYGIGRAFIEGLRTDSLMAGDLRISQIVGAASFVIAIVLFIVFKIITEKKQIPLYVNSDACKELLEADRLAEEERIAKKEAKKNQAAPSILADDADEVEDIIAADTPAGESGKEEDDSSSDNEENTDISDNDNESED